MKIARFLVDGEIRTGKVTGDIVVPIQNGHTTRSTPRELPLAQVRLLPPVAASASIICVGLNYRDHAAEAKAQLPARPLLFSKLASSLAGHDDSIVLPDGAEQVDFEGELGVVIGRRCRNVPVASALDVVRGYTCANDVSARDLQFADGQWMRGKSADTFCPVGPYLTTPDDIGDPQALRIRTRVDGAVMQDSSTAEMVFSVAEIISYASRTITLRPGDLILTGTPAGVGVARSPQVFLRPGDRVEIEIDGIGVLGNPVTADSEQDLS